MSFILDPDTIKKLLNRNEKIYDQSVIQGLRGERVLITGAGGTLGSLISRRLASVADTLIMLDTSEDALFKLKSFVPSTILTKNVFVLADCRIYDSIERVFTRWLPTYVIHCAAYKHVGMLEDDEEAAYQNNYYATTTVMELCSKTYSVKAFVFVSTDKAVEPISVYGASKKDAELYVLKDHNWRNRNKFRPVVVRLGNILGSSNSLIDIYWDAIVKQKGWLVVRGEETERYFMYPQEAVDAVLTAAVGGMPGSVYCADCGEPVRIKDIAERFLFSVFGRREDLPMSIRVVPLEPGEKETETFIGPHEEEVDCMYNGLRKVVRKAQI